MIPTTGDEEEEEVGAISRRIEDISNDQHRGK
jgi:hypothetical protein